MNLKSKTMENLGRWKRSLDKSKALCAKTLIGFLSEKECKYWQTLDIVKTNIRFKIKNNNWGSVNIMYNFKRLIQKHFENLSWIISIKKDDKVAEGLPIKYLA
jgi:hypothetical protein